MVISDEGIYSESDVKAVDEFLTLGVLRGPLVPPADLPPTRCSDPDLLQPQSSERCNNGLRDLGRCGGSRAGPRTLVCSGGGEGVWGARSGSWRPETCPLRGSCCGPEKAQETHPRSLGFYFLLQERNHDGTIHYVHLPPVSKEQEAQLAARGFLPPPQDDFADLCNLPALNEDSILNNLRTRFHKKKIYTYAGSILIAINPFKFLPIYNPKYVKMYENHQLGKLEPHIFAIADVAYYAMLRKRVNQCIVISGESGSGKTQSTNFLIHCLTALSQKGYASGVERTILGAGPVLEVRC
ncbi:unconventional myosin-IXb-like [Gymnodraco acuticeps]|uniref:Unconventional myosin-IXb-like n=1 Tax=Gymnodraco acuticeps TaxID=8218 RepID=A0A6P8SVF3_GYMAC|nr:unconventional myosin-IXb-like [Gymnodraco acuticeps]